MKAARITIVTPTYNRASLLPETIDSILNQSFKDFKYIVVDDGSTDNTQDVLKQYADKLQVCSQANSGEAMATNVGWELCDTEYFAMVSSDDPMGLTWLENMIAFMDQHPDILVAYPDWTIIDSESKPTETIQVSEYNIEHLLAWLECLPGPGSIIRKSVLPKNFPLRNRTFRYMPDLECWFRLALLGPFARVPKNLALWRSHPESISIAARDIQRSKETLRLVKEFYAREALPKDIKKFKLSALSRAYYLASIFSKQKNPWHAIWYRLCSVVLQPFEPQDLPKKLRRNTFMWFVNFFI